MYGSDAGQPPRSLYTKGLKPLCDSASDIRISGFQCVSSHISATIASIRSKFATEVPKALYFHNPALTQKNVHRLMVPFRVDGHKCVLQADASESVLCAEVSLSLWEVPLYLQLGKQKYNPIIEMSSFLGRP